METNFIMQFSTQAPGNFQHERAQQQKSSHNIIKMEKKVGICRCSAHAWL